MWKVEHRFDYGWDDAGWTVNDKPQRFPAKTAAEREIREFIEDSKDLDEPYKRKDFRAVRATPVAVKP